MMPAGWLPFSVLGEPHVEIKPHGRWSYWVIYHPNDLSEVLEPPLVYGRRRAERKAKRILRRELKARERNRRSSTMVRAADLDRPSAYPDTPPSPAKAQPEKWSPWG